MQASPTTKHIFLECHLSKANTYIKSVTVYGAQVKPIFLKPTPPLPKNSNTHVVPFSKGQRITSLDYILFGDPIFNINQVFSQ